MARKSKQAKWDKARASKQRAERKTAVSREKRLANKHKREAIRKQMGDVHIVMKDGIPYMNGDKLGLINGIYRLVNTGLPEGAIKTECDYEAHYDPETCEHGNSIHANCSDCDEIVLNAVAKDEEPIKIGIRNDVAKGKPDCEYPVKSTFERLKDKIRGS